MFVRLDTYPILLVATQNFKIGVFKIYSWLKNVIKYLLQILEFIKVKTAENKRLPESNRIFLKTALSPSYKIPAFLPLGQQQERSRTASQDNILR